MNSKKNELKHIGANVFHELHGFEAEAVICVVGSIFACALFKFVDGISLQAWALETSDAFLRGGISGFSDIMSQNLWNAPHKALPLSGTIGPSNLMYAIWNLPLVLIHYIFKTGYSIPFAARMWGKLFFVLFVAAIGYVVHKIVLNVSHNSRRGILAAILTFGAPTIMISVGYAMQDEVVYEFFIVMGVYEAICGRKNRSLLWLILASITCPLMVLFCIPVVLYSSKKLSETILRLAAILGATVMEILWLSTSYTQLSDGELSQIFSKVTFYTTYGGKYSLLAVIFALIYLKQWFVKDDDSQKLLLWNISVLTTVYNSFSGTTHYRFMICVPFLIISLTIIESEQIVKCGLFSLIGFEIIRIWGMQTKAFLRLYAFPKRLIDIFDLNEVGGETVFTVLNHIFPGLNKLFIVIIGLGIGCILWFLYISYPKNKTEIVCPIPTRFLTVAWCSIQVAILASVCLFLLRAGVLNISIGTKSTIVIDGQNYVEEYYRGKSANKLLITINPSSTGKGYPKGQTLNLDIIDLETEEVIATTLYDASQIRSGKEITFRIDDIDIQSGHWYKFRFYSPERIENADHYMYLHTSGKTANSDKHYAATVENGVTTIGDYDVVSKVITF